MNDALRDGGQDRLALLQTFLRVAEAGSFSAAAQQLATTQPTVSRRVQMLESLLGARLVERSTRGLRLTEEGERCAAQAQDLIDGWHALAEDIDGGEELSGTLRLRVPHAFGQSQLIEPLAAFLTRHPRVSVEWMLQDQLPDFSRENVDCSLLVGEIAQPHLIATQLAEVPRVLVAAPAIAKTLPKGLDRQSPRDISAVLAAQPWLALLAFYRDGIELVRADGTDRMDIPFKPRLGTDSLFALVESARRGLGVALVSQWAVMDDLADGRLVRLLPSWCATPLPISLVYPSRRLQPARLRAFLQVMREVIPTLRGMREIRRR
ncbi:LysR family transcriptional regulator [Roseateles chitosanitabidus]|jgi:DNA-binding transcriptional LysR family regulator|uniref:LysR family transcriptional regulator n=1 Tax=Roseateles chitosanitabidus TaxID=65048 RepID=UPI000832C9D7|nr:LysR family transcriptional regulator [Roseateles chitosanitabidus]MBO9689096.1 LysR family transcriptional regulator [Roseateles chitosanitabidus]